MGNQKDFENQPDTIKFAIHFAFRLYDDRLLEDLQQALQLIGFSKTGMWYELLNCRIFRDISYLKYNLRSEQKRMKFEDIISIPIHFLNELARSKSELGY